MLIQPSKFQNLFIIVTIFSIFISFFSPVIVSKNPSVLNIYNENEFTVNYTKREYKVKTSDGIPITFVRYIGWRKPSIILIHGMGGNHRMFDWDENHSLARFLNKKGWDVWLLNLRTNDDDGDFLFDRNCNLEYINRYWDFDRTLLKKDVVKAVNFVTQKTQNDKVILGGHSYGGYLAYAYSMLIGEENLAGLITTGASPYSNPRCFNPGKLEMLKYGFYFGKKAYVNPFGMPRTYFKKIDAILYRKHWKPTANALFYYNTTPGYIQKEISFHVNSDPAGVYVDMYFGKNPDKYGGDWVDPQTLYNYSANLDKITVPIIFLAGENDTQDPSDDIYRAFENVSSNEKQFFSFTNHSHMDLLWGRYSYNIIFPKIEKFCEKIEID